MQIGIIGLGRMGSFLAEQFADKYDLLLFDINSERKNDMASKLKASAAEKLSEMNNAGIIIMALSTEALPKAAEELGAFLDKENILVNIATTLPREEVEEAVPGNIKVVSAKIVGHAKEMRLGIKPIIVVDGPEAEAVQEVKAIFKELGRVVETKEEYVAKMNSIASEEGIKAALQIKKIMEQEGLPIDWWETAVHLVAAGTMKAFASGDIGPFARRLMDKMENK